MQYAASGATVRVGDEVDIDGARGTVVFSVDDGEYAPAYPQSSWEYLDHGIGVLTVRLGLLHLEDNRELVLVSRPSEF